MRSARALATAAAATAIAAMSACDHGRASDSVTVVPVAGPAASREPIVVVPAVRTSSSATPASECTGAIGDAEAAAVLPLGAARFCVDGDATKTYGDNAKYSKDAVCTTLLDGECEIYLKHFARRFVSLRYVSTASSAVSINVVLTRFAEPYGAKAMFDERVRSVEPGPAPSAFVAPGASVRVGRMWAYVQRAHYFAELSLDVDDPNISQADAERMSDATVGRLAARIAETLPAQ